jgi:iron complex transport system substrate-binding protein
MKHSRVIKATLRLALSVTATAALLLTAACGSDSSSGAGSGRHVTVTAANGSVKIAGAPKRIVSLSPTATEMLFAIHAGDQVVAVDDQSSYPKSAPRTKLSGLSPSADAVAKYRPDLVVVDADRNGLVPALTKLKVPVLVEPAAKQLGDSYDQINDLGTASDHQNDAKQLVAAMQRKLAATAANVGDSGKRLSYYHEVDNTYFSVTSKTFIGGIYGMFGMRNIADRTAGGNDYPQLNSEYIVHSNPDLIFIADGTCCGQSAQTVAKRPGWGVTGAVKTSSVTALDDDIASRWGPRVVDLADDIAAAINKHNGKS